MYEVWDAAAQVGLACSCSLEDLMVWEELVVATPKGEKNLLALLCVHRPHGLRSHQIWR